MKRGSTSLARQWALVRALEPRRRGLRIAELIAHLGSSRATIYRDVAAMRAVGIPVELQRQNGESRVTLYGVSLPPLGPSVLQIASLRIARAALHTLEGTRAVAELDTLLSSYAPARNAVPIPSFARTRPIAPDLVAAIDRALAQQRRARIRYRGARDATPEWRLLDPLSLRVSKGHLYFIAYDTARSAVRTFKLDRISKVEVLADGATPRREVDLDALFAHASKIWSGDPHDVAVRLAPAVARFAPEYPLVHDQLIRDAPGGAVTVTARVSGLHEAIRWTLSWGQHAEALAPAELRSAVAAEVQGAAKLYVVRAHQDATG